ncbi:MAG: DUF87 domain-containing protein, partial [Candidatus Micrarchaeaceae archaeon]
MRQYSISNSRIAAGRICIFRPSEPCGSEEGGIYIGRSLIYRLPFFLDASRLVNPHITVVGMSGSGKSYMLRSIIIRERVYCNAKIFVLDWNGEYRSTIEFLGGKVHLVGRECRIG